jgi:hypothetical protein
MRIPVAALAVFGLLSLETAGAVDLHQLWDMRCHECHGHAGEFARRHLKVEKGELTGRHRKGEQLKNFLGRHEMSADHAEPVYRMLLAQAQTKPVYQQKCAGCHQTAAEFARASLLRRDGVLIGRTNGQPVAEFLKRHGKLTADEVPLVVDSLDRVLGEVGGSMPAAK